MQSLAGKVEVPVTRELFRRVCQCLDGRDWQFQSDEDAGVIRTGCRLSLVNARLQIFVESTDAWKRILVLTFIPLFVPEPRRTSIAELFAQINYNLAIGAFEIDMSDGEIRVKTCIESNNDISNQMFNYVVDSNLALTEAKLDEVLGIAFQKPAITNGATIEIRPAKVTLQ